MCKGRERKHDLDKMHEVNCYLNSSSLVFNPQDIKSSLFQYSSDVSDEEQPSTTFEVSSIARKVFGDLPSLSGSPRRQQNVRQYGKDGSQESRQSVSSFTESNLSGVTKASQSPRTSSDDTSSRQMDRVESAKTSWISLANDPQDTSYGNFQMVPRTPRPLAIRNRDPLSEKPNSAEVVDEDYQKEGSQGDWQARRLSLEIEMLKQQLTEQLRHGAENDAKLLALFVERDGLKTEVEKLKVERKSSQDKENGELDLRWEAEKAKQLIKELQEEVMYEKDKNINLNVQLQKMQDSHVELIAAVEDLEKSLEEQKEEIEELVCKNSELQASTTIVSHAESEREKQWMQKFLVQEKKIHSLETSIIMYQEYQKSEQGLESETGLEIDSDQIIKSLKTEIIDLEKDSEELTKENTDLIFKLNAIKKELALKNESVDQLQFELTKTRSPQASSELSSGEVGRPQKLVSNLEEKLQENGEFHKLQTKNNERLLVDLQVSLQELRAENDNLDNELKRSEAYASSLRMDLEAAKGECAMLENQNKMLLLQAGEWPTRFQIEGIRLHSSGLEQHCHSKFVSNKQELESRLSYYEAQNGLHTSQEENVPTAVQYKEQLNTGHDDHQLIKSNQEIVQLLNKITDLEEQLRHVREQRDAYRLERVESVLQEESTEYHSKLLELEEKKAEVMEECLAHKKAREHLESQVDHLKNEIAGQVKIRLLVEQHTEALQGTLQELEELLDRVKKDYLVSTTATTSLESEVKHRQLVWDEKEKKLVEDLNTLLVSKIELEKRAIKAEESLTQMELEKAAEVDCLQSELRQLKEQLALLFQEKENLASEAHLQAAEFCAGKTRLEEELVYMQEKIKQSETQAASVTIQYHKKMQELFLDKDVLEERELQIAKELKEMFMQVEVFRDKEGAYKSKLDELESKVATLEKDKQNLVKANQELKTKASELELLRIELDGLRSSLNATISAKSEAESLLQNLRSDHLRLESHKSRLEDKISTLEQSQREMEELRNAKKVLEGKILQLQSELDEQGTTRASEAEQRIESMRLRRQNNDFKNKLLQQEVANEQFQHKVQLLEGELFQKVNALSAAEKKLQEREKVETGHIQESVELKDLQSKVKLLEDETKYKALELESMREEFKKKEFSLCQKIELLELAHQELEQRNEDTDKIAESQKSEIRQLQIQYEVLSHDNQEHVSKLHTAENFESEVLRLRKANEQLENRVSQLMEDDTVERANLENDLAEALKEIKFYELQLQRELAKQQSANTATSAIILSASETSALREKISHLEEELKEMHNRYLCMSLKCAEVEAEREELFMTVRNLRNAKKI
ncbi:hypothetical protein O6H91_15G040900 [Diphasiastrum complanatum]|uniref:Uncharacterized protein n=1 Tax=Diphasiastrum complanatum TaxID=34168 RepID=A0ACC2BHT2_DIPCM|nr:hypothetical protein O6H91_15G040900 [Diphasiastrum complanatum]